MDAIGDLKVMKTDATNKLRLLSGSVSGHWSKHLAAYRFILAAVFFVGLAHIALLPPFEGFDETAHWSSIAQWGHGGGMPVYGTAGIDRAIREYPGPLPYTAPGGVHYDNFDPKFSVGPHESRPPEFFEGEGHNWQAQHPPLYYLLLRPVFRMFNSFSWADQFFALRAMSWLFAFAGFAIGVEASKALFAESGNKAAAVSSSGRRSAAGRRAYRSTANPPG